MITDRTIATRAAQILSQISPVVVKGSLIYLRNRDIWVSIENGEVVCSDSRIRELLEW